MLELSSGLTKSAPGSGVQSRDRDWLKLGSLQKWVAQKSMLSRKLSDGVMGDFSSDPSTLQNCELWGRKEAKAGARGTDS